MQVSKINHPSQLTPEWHQAFLSKLRESLSRWYGEEQKLASNNSKLFVIRDWWLVQEGHDSIIQVFIDTQHPEGVTADDCLSIHRWFINTNIFDDFGDDFSIQVSSSGAEPPLREYDDFCGAVGKEIYLETWTKQNDRLRYIMQVDSVENCENCKNFVRLREGTKVFEIPISEVKRAYLRYHLPKIEKPKKSKKR